MNEKTDQKFVYLDHAAGAPISNSVKNEVKRIMECDVLPNPEAGYNLAAKWRKELAGHKDKIARVLGIKAPSIMVTNGATEASDMFLEFVKDVSVDKNYNFCVMDTEHSSIMQKANELGKVKKLKISDIKLDGGGRPDLSAILKVIDDSTVLITMQLVNNETGQIMPVKELAREIKNIRADRENRGLDTPLYLHSDASQAGTVEDLHIPKLGVNAMTINGAKLGGLPNSGLLYISPELARWISNREELKKEDPIRVATLSVALERAQSKRPAEKKRLSILADLFWREFKKGCPDSTLNLESKLGKTKQAGHILSIRIPGVNAERLVILAGQHGVYIGTGAACSANNGKPSHVLKAIGCTDTEIASSIRISFGANNKSKADVIWAAKKLAELSQHDSVKE